MLAFPWSSDNGASMTSVQPTHCPEDGAECRLFVTAATLGPAPASEPSPSKEWELWLLTCPRPKPCQRGTHSLLGSGSRAGVHNKVTLLCIHSPGLLEFLCAHVLSVVVLNCLPRGRKAPGAEAGEMPVDVSSPKSPFQPGSSFMALLQIL